MRILSIGSERVNDWPVKLVPLLRLKGEWLRQLGWEIGDKVKVEANHDSITIQKSSEIQKKIEYAESGIQGEISEMQLKDK